ncbi:hypothetical protein EYF80_065189 [Liparis tanakae]|uniref:Uncharacterized protein n=1 Tax=Liparis tanakae TaxID=230148 RepID=A0A4Z2E6Y4_9TELE|nr:hypothetical protein EYF80_065189 [Liparis tanakae]
MQPASDPVLRSRPASRRRNCQFPRVPCLPPGGRGAVCTLPRLPEPGRYVGTPSSLGSSQTGSSQRPDPLRPDPLRDPILSDRILLETRSSQTWSSQRPDPLRDLVLSDLVLSDLVLSDRILSGTLQRKQQTIFYTAVRHYG